jgi:mRNA interferase RelE/StbE
VKVVLSERTIEALRDAPLTVRHAFSKQLRFLLSDLHHPSLRAKKYNERLGVWQARVNLGWRFYFSIVRDTYYIEDVMPHPK